VFYLTLSETPRGNYSPYVDSDETRFDGCDRWLSQRDPKSLVTFIVSLAGCGSGRGAGADVYRRDNVKEASMSLKERIRITGAVARSGSIDRVAVRRSVNDSGFSWMQSQL